MPKRIIGLSGTFASGKDTLAHYLVGNYHFMHLSTGDILRQEALRLRGSIERPVLFEVANQLRRERGADVFVHLALRMFQAHAEKYSGVVISGIRSIGEATAIKEAGGTLVFVDAAPEIRYQRMISRQRDAESALTFEEFKAGEEKESKITTSDPTVQNLPAMQQMADVVLTNDNDLDVFIQSGLHALHITENNHA